MKETNRKCIKKMETPGCSHNGLAFKNNIIQRYAKIFIHPIFVYLNHMFETCFSRVLCVFPTTKAGSKKNNKTFHVCVSVCKIKGTEELNFSLDYLFALLLMCIPPKIYIILILAHSRSAQKKQQINNNKK